MSARCETLHPMVIRLLLLRRALLLLLRPAFGESLERGVDENYDVRVGRYLWPEGVRRPPRAVRRRLELQAVDWRGHDRVQEAPVDVSQAIWRRRWPKVVIAVPEEVEDPIAPDDTTQRAR